VRNRVLVGPGPKQIAMQPARCGTPKSFVGGWDCPVSVVSPVRLRPRWKDPHRAHAVPEELGRDVVAVTRRGEASIAQVVRDLGFSKSCPGPLAEDRRRRGLPRVGDRDGCRRQGISGAA
jgi:hypothetical protein